MAIMLVVAGRGEGKTSYIRRMAEIARAAGRPVGGILSPAVFAENKRIGYDLLDLGTGECRPLARETSDAPPGATRVGAYTFDDDAIRVGNAAISGAIQAGCTFVAVDEVGPLEFNGGGWAAALESALNRAEERQTLWVAVRRSLADELPPRFPTPTWATHQRVCPPWPGGLHGLP